MKAMHILRTLSALVLAAGTGAASAQSAPPAGKLWPFEAVPHEYFRTTHGFVPSDDWLERARIGALKIDGIGTASFVSGEGLILTNQHCIRDTLDRMATGKEDANRDGFVAWTRDDERRMPGMRVRQLVAIEDVTDAMLAGATPGATSSERERARSKSRRRILDEARERYPGLDPQVIELYRGARHHLYLYEVWNDVRLVFSPHLAVAYFGGSADNFSYPHFAPDFALLRAYRNGEPADTTASHYTLAETPVEEGEPVFAVGNPGWLRRHETLAETRWYAEGKAYCAALDLGDQVRILADYLDAHPDERSALASFEFSLVTASKYMRAARTAFADERRRDREQAFERELVARVTADPDLAERCGNPWAETERIVAAAGDLARRTWFQTPAVSDSRWFEPLLRGIWVVESVHPDASAKDRAQARERLGRKRSQGAAGRLMPQFFAAHLDRAREVLGPQDPAVAAMLDGREPDDAVHRLLTESRIASTEYVDELLAGGWDAVRASTDPAVAAARVLYPLRIRNQEQTDAVERALEAQGELVGVAVDALFGPEVCPGPSFSLRLKDGVVRGYEQLGTRVPASTYFTGMYARAQEFPGHRDFELPALWRERRSQLDLSVPLNFACTVDIVGGSSGSAVLDRDGEVVGLIFDGNWQMVENDYVYLDDQPRAIAVHTAAILETLRAIHAADHLVAELVRGNG